jgi:hypothetical protein
VADRPAVIEQVRRGLPPGLAGLPVPALRSMSADFRRAKVTLNHNKTGRN